MQRRKQTNVGALPPHPRDLSLCSPKLEGGKQKGSEPNGTLPSSFGPHAGARVVSQQSPILRVGAAGYVNVPFGTTGNQSRVLITVKGTNRTNQQAPPMS